jgi:hypothetical protein
MAVTFTDTGEYLQELGADRDNVRRGIVRLTMRGTPSTALAGAITHLSVESGARIDGGEIVRYRRHVGDLWGHENDADVKERAQLLVGELKTGIKALGLEVRAGLYDDLVG